MQDFQSAEAINSPSNRDFSVSPRREAEFVQSTRKERERVTWQLRDAGADDETANAGGEIWANHLLARARALGTNGQGRLRPDALTPAELDKLNVRGGEDAEVDWGGNVYDQAVRAGLDMDERVPVVDLSGVADRAKGMNWRGLLRHLKSQIRQEPSISRDALAFLKMPANTEKLRHIAYSGTQVPAKVKPLRNASVLSLPELMQNAVYVEEAPNTKTDRKPDVLKYHRFYVPVVFNGKVLTIRIVAEEKKTSDKLFPIDVDAYDVIVERKRTPSPKGDNDALLARRESSLRETTIREMLHGVKGMDGEYYAQSSLPDTGTERERSAIVEAAKTNGAYLKAPNGNETNLTPEQWVLVRTERFKEWFGDWENDPENASKVLDGNGEPLVVYHGTPKGGFKAFNTDRGAFFADERTANRYTRDRESKGITRNSRRQVYPVFLNIRTPLDITAWGRKYPDVFDPRTGENKLAQALRALFEEKGLSGERVRQAVTKAVAGKYDKRIAEATRPDKGKTELIANLEKWKRETLNDLSASIKRYRDGVYGYITRDILNLNSPKADNAIASFVGAGFQEHLDETLGTILKDLGFDGILYKESDTFHDSPAAVVFSPAQIKSVNNRGTFDSTGNIYNQSAWHGSPYRFDEFDLGEIGSGEGAQVHGWGLYFAEDQNVAIGYREKLGNLAEQSEIDYDAVEAYKARFDNGTPEREALDSVLEVFRNFGGEADGESSFAAYEATRDDIADRKRDVEGEIANLEDLKEEGESIDENALEELKAELKQAELEEKILDECFVVGESYTGRLFEVDVPENDVLLDEQKDFTEQPEKVQKTLMNLAQSLPDSLFNPHERSYDGDFNDKLSDDFESNWESLRPTRKEFMRRLLSAESGKKIYEILSDALYSDEKASKILNKHGVKGITYYGREDGRCFVVFDDKAISVINKFNQRENAIRRGQIRIGSHGEGLVTLFKNADRSTFFHEIGHMMLDDLIADGLLEKANARTRADLETVKAYLGIGDMDLSKRHTFDGAEKARYAEAQERFARSFEAYLMEGKSPTAEMRSVFAKIKQWLIDIYRDIKRLGVELSPEVREVFDRLLTTPEHGDFGPIFRGYEGEAAIEKLLKERQGEVVGAMSDPRLGENSSIDFVWGQEGDPRKEYSGGYGLAHIEAKHGAEMIRCMPEIIRSGKMSFETNDRVYFDAPQGRVVLKRQWMDNVKNWVLTSYVPENTKKASRSAQDPEIGGRTEESLSSSDGKPFDKTVSQKRSSDNRDFSVRSDLPQVTVTAEPGNKSAGTLIRIKDIYDKLRAIAPVRKGVSAPADVAGYYTPLTGVARERHWGDFPTALHEIGHALDYKLGLRESVRDAETSRQVYDELCELGKATSPQNVTALYEKLHGRSMRASGAEARGPDVSAAALKFEEAQRYLMKEGIAEYFRAYAYNPDLMEVVAPEYTKLFREALEAHEEYRQPVSELFDVVRSYSELTPEQKLRAGMIRGDEKVKNQKGWHASIAEAWDGFRQKFDDRLRYLEQMQNLLRDRARELAKEHSAFVGNYYCRFKNNGFTK